MKIIRDIWFSGMGGLVGIVVGVDEITGKGKAYIGVASGVDPEIDKKMVARGGGKLPLAVLDEIRSVLALPRKKTTGMRRIECSYCGGSQFDIRKTTKVHVDFDSEDVDGGPASQNEVEVFCSSCGRLVKGKDAREMRQMGTDIPAPTLGHPMAKHTIEVGALQCGVLYGLILEANETGRRILKDVEKQLVTLKLKAEEAAGVTKEILPGGMLRLTDKAGFIIERAPYPYETEGN